jgi:hypothetical protein
VTENTAKILEECGVITGYRGETFVKGAGYIKTYFVPLDENFNLIRKEHSIDFHSKGERNRHYSIRNSCIGSSSSDTASTSTRDNSLSEFSIAGDSYYDINNSTSKSYEPTDNDSYNSEPNTNDTRV